MVRLGEGGQVLAASRIKERFLRRESEISLA